MTKPLQNNLKLVGYLVTIACLVVFSRTVYRVLSDQDDASSRPAATNQMALNPSETNAAPANLADEEPPRKSARMGQVMTYGGLAFASLVGLGLLAARDLSRYFANRVDDFIFNDDLKGVHDPEYEEAERVWANGQYLESIQLMRDYLKRHPREQYVALRIAEIYETNLSNYLAAALEYEEVLKKKLPAERWGWAAIHLANLYSGKLNKMEPATALLRRIADEFGQTAAARKARERLGLPEPVVAAASTPPPAPKPEPPPPPAPPSGNLPRGFRPK